MSNKPEHTPYVVQQPQPKTPDSSYSHVYDDDFSDDEYGVHYNSDEYYYDGGLE